MYVGMRGIPSLDFRSGLGESMAKRQRTGQHLSPIAGGQSPEPPPGASQGAQASRGPDCAEDMLVSRLHERLLCSVILTPSCVC